MMRRGLGWILVGLLWGSVLLAEYKVFELGFDPGGKRKIIEDMISDEGKVYSLRAGTVFVVDEPEVLEAIEAMLKNLAGQMPKQIRLTIRRRGQSEEKERDVDVGFKIGRNEKKITVGLGDRETKKNTHQNMSLTTLSGERARFALETTEDRLLYWRRYFVPEVRRITSEAEILEILPVLSGTRVMAEISTLYVARVEGRDLVFKTGEIQTKVVLPIGRWSPMGGNSGGGDERTRQNLGLSQTKKSAIQTLDIDVMAEIIEIKPVERNRSR